MHESTSGTRRSFLSGTAAAALLGLHAATARGEQPADQNRPLPAKGAFPVKAIASHNGLEATRRAYQMIVAGDDPLDAVIAGVKINEDDPNDMTVGYGGLPNEEGIVQLDAAVMHGPSHRAGAVAALEKIRNPAGPLLDRQIELVEHGAVAEALGDILEADHT